MWVLYAPKLENDWFHYLSIFSPQIHERLKEIKVPFVSELHQSDQRCDDNALPSTQPDYISKLSVLLTLQLYCKAICHR